MEKKPRYYTYFSIEFGKIIFEYSTENTLKKYLLLPNLCKNTDLAIL